MKTRISLVSNIPLFSTGICRTYVGSWSTGYYICRRAFRRPTEIAVNYLIWPVATRNNNDKFCISWNVNTTMFEGVKSCRWTDSYLSMHEPLYETGRVSLRIHNLFFSCWVNRTFRSISRSIVANELRNWSFNPLPRLSLLLCLVK